MSVCLSVCLQKYIGYAMTKVGARQPIKAIA